MEDLQTLLGPSRLLNFSEVLVAFSVAFILSSVITSVYRYTHHGLSYSRVFVQAMLLASITSCMMIMVIGNNLARGLGILGALAIIRFRTPVRDPRDMVFLFCCLAVGIGCGARVFAVASVGAFFFSVVALYLHWAPFSAKSEFEGLLRFLLPPDSDSHDQLRAIFESHLSSATLVAVREATQGDYLEYSYQTRMLRDDSQQKLMQAIQALPDVEEPSLLMQRSTVEI
ncbi:DUF4956 domain-containing protein [Coraliomargarita akajimensis]|uniref:DUF4956 domain-containing protein n=1 Tax=Coraliomargarita akajimensis (strain DSM 45221 / IAM 15411 / JCM 23193 / KCTC 12865 / 04OKA010-24) TaxID=583355 RepID=D5EI85_CORAD|nr:DUF4956 domain-containing protein [Coraliomargarita akajimensis]ADE56125.1 conserved hypothetical protein [Coraliomargarita akajimensis DSM 45221]